MTVSSADTPARPAAPATRQRGHNLLQCADVHLQAAYLAETDHGTDQGGGPGYLLTLTNTRSTSIKLIEPVPSSVDWFAEAPDGRWVWRASSGGGGALADALSPHGALLASPGAAPTQTQAIVVGPHDEKQWTVASSRYGFLAYRPGCERCKNPVSSQFRAVLAYAYLAGAPGDGKELLDCGLRSNMVVMPPLQ